MKALLYFSVFLLLLSCKKDPAAPATPDYRDDFTGEYSFTNTGTYSQMYSDSTNPSLIRWRTTNFDTIIHDATISIKGDSSLAFTCTLPQSVVESFEPQLYANGTLPHHYPNTSGGVRYEAKGFFAGNDTMNFEYSVTAKNAYRTYNITAIRR